MDHSKIPFLHEIMDKIPFPGAPWHEVITTYPSFDHLHWSFLFAILSAVLQITCFLLTKILAPVFVGYTSTPPLPRRMKLNKSMYIKLGEAVNYTQMIDIKSYSDDKLKELSDKYCNGKLSIKEVEKYLKFCNKHHLGIMRDEKRFQECLFPIFCKAFTLSFGIYAVYDKDWLYDRAKFYMGWPNNQGLEFIADIKLLYVVHIGWYIYKLFAQTFLDRHLKDFFASLIHHCAAIALLSLSYTSGVVRVGVAVLLLHDPADIVLQCGKLLRLCKQQILTNITFALLVLTWFATRVAVYPYHCVMSGFYDFYGQHGGKNDNDDRIIAICCALMCCLYALHLHWFWMIIGVLHRAISGKGVSDHRSDDSEDEADDGKTHDATKK